MTILMMRGTYYDFGVNSQQYYSKYIAVTCYTKVFLTVTLPTKLFEGEGYITSQKSVCVGPYTSHDITMMDKKNDHKTFSSYSTVNCFLTETGLYKMDTWCWSLPFCSYFTVTINSL